MIYDVVIVGGGPAGLSAALALGRARKTVLLCDAGPRRNAAAVHLHNFVTRDGVTPDEFRRIGREELQAYPNVEVRDVHVSAIGGERGAFAVRVGGDDVVARRVLLCTGLIDDMPDIEGFAALWGKSIFLCPYCHGWEIQNQRFAFLATSLERIAFALLLRGWTRDVVVLTDGKLEVPEETVAMFDKASVKLERRPLKRLIAVDDRLQRIEFADGGSIERDAVFCHPHQRQVAVVAALDLKLDAGGFVAVEPMHRETSIPGIYAGGDLMTGAQGAIIAAAAGSWAAGTLNHGLTMELAMSGALP